MGGILTAAGSSFANGNVFFLYCLKYRSLGKSVSSWMSWISYGCFTFIFYQKYFKAFLFSCDDIVIWDLVKR